MQTDNFRYEKMKKIRCVWHLTEAATAKKFPYSLLMSSYLLKIAEETKSFARMAFYLCSMNKIYFHLNSASTFETDFPFAAATSSSSSSTIVYLSYVEEKILFVSAKQLKKQFKGYSLLTYMHKVLSTMPCNAITVECFIGQFSLFSIILWP